jgi:hypothetical protein
MRYGSLLDALRAAAARHEWAIEMPMQAPALTIHAEGDAGDEARVREFNQSALLGEVHAPHSRTTWHSTAFERFTPHGPLALLPLPEPGRWALVWCDQDAHCRTRQETDREALSRELTDLIGSRLGAVSIIGPLTVANLTRRLRRDVVGNEEVWIGNAAQSLHPVAGQGLNLGLGDVDALARVIAEREPAGRVTLLMWIDSPMSTPLTSIAISSGILSASQIRSSSWRTMLSTPPFLRPGDLASLMKSTGTRTSTGALAEMRRKSAWSGRSETGWKATSLGSVRTVSPPTVSSTIELKKCPVPKKPLLILVRLHRFPASLYKHLLLTTIKPTRSLGGWLTRWAFLLKLNAKLAQH